MRGAAAARAAKDGRAICIGRKTRASPPPRDIDSGTGKGPKLVVPETGTGKLDVSVPENGTGFGTGKRYREMSWSTPQIIEVNPDEKARILDFWHSQVHARSH